MAELQFYNDNAAIRYPFVDDGPLLMTHSISGSVALSNSSVVDFTCITGVDFDFNTANSLHRVYLSQISRAGDSFTFTFAFNATSLISYTLTFIVSASATEFTRIYSSASDSTAAALPINETCDYLYAEGWLTVGDLTELATLLSSGQTLTRADGSVWIEPSRTQSLYKSFVRSINIANEPRTRTPDNCSNSSSSYSDSLIVNAQCLDGIIKFKEGHNITINQIDTQNKLTFTASPGAGLGVLCEDLLLYPDEKTPAGSKLLSGGPACNELITGINGLSGPAVQLLAGTGISIIDDPNTHTITIIPTMHGLDVCLPSLSSDGYTPIAQDFAGKEVLNITVVAANMTAGIHSITLTTKDLVTIIVAADATITTTTDTNNPTFEIGATDAVTAANIATCLNANSNLNATSSSDRVTVAQEYYADGLVVFVTDPGENAAFFLAVNYVSS